jgi:hypothetical protein
VDRFLASHPGFIRESERALHPLRDGVDGAYDARLRGPGSSAGPSSGTSSPV